MLLSKMLCFFFVTRLEVADTLSQESQRCPIMLLGPHPKKFVGWKDSGCKRVGSAAKQEQPALLSGHGMSTACAHLDSTQTYDTALQMRAFLGTQQESRGVQARILLTAGVCHSSRTRQATPTSARARLGAPTSASELPREPPEHWIQFPACLHLPKNSPTRHAQGRRVVKNYMKQGLYNCSWMFLEGSF